MKKVLMATGIGLVILRGVAALVALLLPTALIVEPAGAWEHSKTYRVEHTSSIAPHPVLYTVILGADWNDKTAAQCASLYPCFGDVNWRKGYNEGIQIFDHWLPDVNDSGIRSDGVRWKSKKVEAQFRYCIVPIWDGAFCVRHTTWVKVTIRTDGTSSMSYHNE